MPATSIAIGAAVGASTAASISASNARDAECRDFIDEFNNIKNPSINEQREYAQCVYRLHGDGEPMTNNEILITKCIVSVLVIAFIIGAIKGYKDDGIVGMFMDGMMYAVMLLVGVFVIGLFIAGLLFLLS